MSDISELFARDPLTLTKEDLDQIIDHLRKARTQFNLGVKQAGSMKEKKPKAVKTTATLDDLGL